MPTEDGDSPYDLHRDLLEDVEARTLAVALIDEEVDDLMRQVRQLQFKKSQHQAKIVYYQGLTTLARRLPSELLACILEECIGDGWTRTPLIASHVCSEWRKATKISSLWSRVYVNSDAKDPCGRTRFWLENAQSSPLHITVDVRNDSSQLPGIMNLLLSRISHWRTLTITSINPYHANYILALCNRPCPELCTINVTITQESETDHDHAEEGALTGLMDSFYEAPHFRILRISRNILPSHGTIPPSITHLSITLPSNHGQMKISVDKVLRLLEGLPLLQDLSITLQRGQDREFEPALNENNVVGLVDLRALILIGPLGIFGILPHLVTPTLVSLRLRSSLDPMGHPEEQTGSYIKLFIERASPPLSSLELHDIDLPIPDFLACLSGLSSLRELRLHESDISDSVIQQFHKPNDLCPLLSRLDLRWCGQVTGRSLVALVQARAPYADYGGTPHPIDKITVINCSFVKEQDVVDLAQTTVCQIVMNIEDYCRPFGCCQNERYRRRFRLRRAFRSAQDKCFPDLTNIIA